MLCADSDTKFAADIREDKILSECFDNPLADGFFVSLHAVCWISFSSKMIVYY